MNRLNQVALKREFELRILVSLSIVAGVSALSATAFRESPPVIVLLGALAGADPGLARKAGFLAIAFLMALVSLLRMWAGSELTPRRVMAFKVQTDALRTAGPYLLVRNPIYLADFLAMCGFSCCFPPAGLLMPLLFYLHYARLIRYEEQSLGRGFREEFAAYARSVPRLLPSCRSARTLPASLKQFAITPEGFRHNALYVLFVPGFVAAALTGNFLVAAIIGVPGVADWAIIHTKIGRDR
jgi:protein-S-isoprenylcysteine O-methyltransferase Ste14